MDNSRLGGRASALILVLGMFFNIQDIVKIKFHLWFIIKMLLVKTKLGLSKIHGIGLFADENIKKGTIIWKFTPDFDLKFTKAQIEKFPKQLQGYLKIICG